MTGVGLVSQEEVESLLQRFEFRTLSGKSLLITGATGMVGSYLCEAILRGCEEAGLMPPELTLLTRKNSGSNLSTIRHRKNVIVFEAALSTWRSDVEFDYCVHAASPASPTQYSNAEAVSEANVGFLKSLSKGRLPGVLLFLSSGEIYGPQTPLGVTEDFEGELAPKSLRSIYPEAKKSAERLMMQLGEDGRTKAVVARLFHSYGPGVREHDGRSFADFLWAGALGKDIVLRSSGSDVRTFMYLEDSIAGVLSCLTGGAAQGIDNVGSETPYHLADFADVVNRLTGVRVIKNLNRDLASEAYVHSANSSLVPSNAKLLSLGWSQKVSLEEGIRRSISWIRVGVSRSKRN